MKDELVIIGILLALILVLTSNIIQNHRISDLEDEVQSMNEQICYIESELE